MSHTDLLPPPSLPTTTTTISTPTSPTTVTTIMSTSNTAMEDTAHQHYVIGDNLRHKAFYEDAIEEFQKALHIQQPLLGDGNLPVANTHYALGLCFRATKDFTQALYHLHRAATIWEETISSETKQEVGKEEKEEEPSTSSGSDTPPPPSLSELLFNCKLNIARTHHSQGVEHQRDAEYDKSIVEHSKALAIREHVLGKSHLETARTYYVMGCALSDRGQFDEAMAELRRALRVRVLTLGKDHTDTKELLDNLHTVLIARGGMTEEEYAEYKSIVLQSLDFETQGEDHFTTGEYAHAMVCFRRALSLEEQVLGDLHPTTCDLYLRMADSLCELGDLEAALVEYKSAIAIYERLMGKFHVKVASIYDKLAGILMDKGEYETALSFYAKAYGIYDAILGNHDDTRTAMKNLRLAASKEGNARESMGLLEKAEQQFQERQNKAEEKKQKLTQPSEVTDDGKLGNGAAVAGKSGEPDII